MIESTFSRRDLLTLGLSAKKDSLEGNIAISKNPPVYRDQLSFLETLASIGMLTASRLPVSRGGFLIGVAVGAGSLLMRPERAEATDYQIVPVEYPRSLSWVRSFPWLGMRNGIEAAGLNKWGPWDKYDALDREINGDRARSVYWPRMGGPASTREWLTGVLLRNIEAQALKDGPTSNMNEARWRAARWSGYCLDAAAASYFAPPIEGSVDVLGIEFSEWDRLVIATMRWSGLAREFLDLSDEEGMISRIKNQEPVAVNYSNDSQDWWGLVRDVDENGNVVITKAADLNEDGEIEERWSTVYESFEGLKNAAVLNEDRAQPGYAGNFAVVNRPVGGLIVGTHKLAT